MIEPSELSKQQKIDLRIARYEERTKLIDERTERMIRLLEFIADELVRLNSNLERVKPK